MLPEVTELRTVMLRFIEQQGHIPATASNADELFVFCVGVYPDDPLLAPDADTTPQTRNGRERVADVLASRSFEQSYRETGPEEFDTSRRM